METVSSFLLICSVSYPLAIFRSGREAGRFCAFVWSWIALIGVAIWGMAAAVIGDFHAAGKALCLLVLIGIGSGLLPGYFISVAEKRAERRRAERVREENP